MIADTLAEYEIPDHHVKEFFLARQPILNRNQEVFAYEFLYRSAASGPANIVDDVSATASVIAHMSELGIENLVGNSVGFLNVDSTVLLSDFINFLPPEKVVLEILETVKVTSEIVERLQELAKAGYQFALDDVITHSDDVKLLASMAQVVKVDIRGMPKDTLVKLSRQLKMGNKKLLAEKVETHEEFQICLDLGFDYFQGYYFAKPVVLSGKKLTPSQMTIMKLINQIVADEEGNDLESTIKRDVPLSLKLLKLVNSPGAGIGRRIESVRQALMVLGRLQLQRWLQILLYASASDKGSMKLPLLVLATTRGKLLELMAQKTHPDNRSLSDKAFTVGIMSLMDVLFGVGMEKVVEELSLANDVKDALLHRQGKYGGMLQLAEYLERLEESSPHVLPLLNELDLSVEDLDELQLKAFQWSSSLSSSAN